jgi:hypothetical protein
MADAKAMNEKIALLTEQLESNIHSLVLASATTSSTTGSVVDSPTGPRRRQQSDQLIAEIDRIKLEAFKSRSPGSGGSGKSSGPGLTGSSALSEVDVEVALQLFRKYADAANSIKDNLAEKDRFRSASSGVVANGGVFDAVPEFIYRGHREELSGKSIFRTNIFWYRVVIFGLSLTAFILSVRTPFIHESKLSTYTMMTVSPTI